MTTNDIISHPKQSAYDFYRKLTPTTLSEASNEPLKIGDLVELQFCMQQLYSGKIVTFGEALCFVCIDSLVRLYRRKYPLTDNEKEFIAEQMARKYKHWSVLDLPTFVSMCVGSRLPTNKSGEIEYELIVLDIPSIMGKLEVYNRMRPNREQLQGMSPVKASAKKTLSDWQLTHLFCGQPHTFASRTEAERYWFSIPNKNNPEEMAYIASITVKKTNFRQEKSLKAL